MATGLVAYDSGSSDEDSEQAAGSTTKGQIVRAVRLQSAPAVEKPTEPEASDAAAQDDSEAEDSDNGDNSVAMAVPSPVASDDSDKEDWPFKVKPRQAARLMPSPPRGNCSNSLQRKIEAMLETKHRTGRSLTQSVQSRKDFRNPSIYEKLVSFLDLDELGSNFTSFNPAGWGPESYYEKLAAVQKDQFDKKKKAEETAAAHKTHVEFVTGTKRPPTSSNAESEQKKRRSKWDSGPNKQ
ncbi:SAP30-binding protein-like [Sycon ciliatum]|uniref:SAP30-binding protein-like n=1 Tax=Sycon ciliatum TaxID=27933 RepID=UPI0020A9F97F|eukprot:scpid83247/ scgid35230/ SAP30-binding protein; Transcriptional regulator protein HCNGP